VLAVKLPDWLSNTNPLSGGIIFSVCPATRYITLGAIGITCAITHGVYSPRETSDAMRDKDRQQGGITKT
jgi:hypothetical protein